MRRWTVFWIGLLTASWAGGQETLPLGTWQVDRPPTTVSTFYASDAPIPYDGRQVTFAADSFAIFFSRKGYPPFREEAVVCRQPAYEWSREGEEVFYQVNDERLSALIPSAGDTATVLRVYCLDQDAGATFYFVDEHWWLLAYRGLFCYLTDQPETPRRKKHWWCPFHWKKRD